MLVHSLHHQLKLMNFQKKKSIKLMLDFYIVLAIKFPLPLGMIAQILNYKSVLSSYESTVYSRSFGLVRDKKVVLRV